MRLTSDQLQSLRRGDAGLLRALRPVFHQAARAGCAHAKVTADVFAEDVNQELWMLFLGPVGERFDPQYNLEPWLIEASRRIALNLRRKSGKEMLLEDAMGGFDEESRDLGSDLQGTGSAVTAIADEDAIDREKALKYLINNSDSIRNLSMHFVVTQPRSDVTRAPVPEVGQTPRAPSRAHTKSAQATEIRNIRETLQFTHEEMASKLGVRMATYQSYEYGRVRTVPQDVMDRARALLDDQSYSYAREKYGSRSIQDILKEWAERMGVAPTVSDLARMLGINKSTTSRWLDGQVNPTPYELVRLESIVLQQERRLSRAKDATD